MAASCSKDADHTADTNNDNKDSKEVAKDMNDEKFDSTNIEDDTKFAVAAADGGLMEVRLGELALKNGSSAKVKEFAKLMVKDHGKANEELKELAAKKNISLPADLSDDAKDKYEDLAKKKGNDFDDAYTEFMVKDHKDDISDFKKEAEKGNDPEVRAWAAGKLSTLEHHLQMAEAAEEIVDKNDKDKK
ncbi:MAG: DUF4142 domain-containing protein [Opitutaceae bacterium]|nr:DUF4142 domain-containing protein [Cytophagales bacterium]